MGDYKIVITNLTEGRRLKVKKLNLELSNNEYRALQSIIENSGAVCRKGCVYRNAK